MPAQRVDRRHDPVVDGVAEHVRKPSEQRRLVVAGVGVVSTLEHRATLAPYARDAARDRRIQPRERGSRRSGTSNEDVIVVAEDRPRETRSARLRECASGATDDEVAFLVRSEDRRTAMRARHDVVDRVRLPATTTAPHT
jgi:hypothetical protein